MKLSRETIKMFKTFSSINSSLIIRPGEPLRTITNTRSVMGSAEVEEDFPVQAGIYDLPEFLGTLGLFKDPELDFQENSVVISEGGTRVEYVYCDPEMVTSIEKDPNFPDGEDQVEFDITRGQLQQIMKGAGTLNLTDIRLRHREDGAITLGAADSRGAIHNSIEVVVGQDEREVEYEAVFSVDNIRVNQDFDYHVRVSFKGLSHWQATNSPRPVNFYIGTSQQPAPFFQEKGE